MTTAAHLVKVFFSIVINKTLFYGSTARSSLRDLLHGSEYVLTYEDKDGDWMLVGDVPWRMFADSCRRLRIMKGTEAIVLAPRPMEKSRSQKETMHAMWKPQKFKMIYLIATLYVMTLTLPSAAAVYWAFGDNLLTHSNALSLLPRTAFRDSAVVLMLIHQFITFGFACTPLYFVWEKFVGVHETKSLFKRALVRLPVVVPIWFLAIIFPFFGPINSTVGSLLVSFIVYIIPALAHMVTFASASSREVIIYIIPALAHMVTFASPCSTNSLSSTKFFGSALAWKSKGSCYLL